MSAPDSLPSDQLLEKLCGMLANADRGMLEMWVSVEGGFGACLSLGEDEFRSYRKTSAVDALREVIHEASK